jgi:hypothetical protein
MTDTDLATQRATTEAVAELARRLRYPTGGPEQEAREFVAWLHDHDWRHIPRPLPIVTGHPGDPPSAEFRRAREQLTRPEGDDR